MLAVLLVPGVAWAAPANDSFANATDASSLPFGPASADTGDATMEGGEPKPTQCFGDIGNTVWYKLSAPSAMRVTADTVGSSYDTVVAVYTGTSVSTLTHVTCSDDASGIGRVSRVSFDATADTQYFIQVGAVGGEAGDLEFRLSRAGSIAGTVTDADEEPLAGICVSAYDGISLFGSMTTVEDGAFSIDDLFPGQYVVQLEDCITPIDHAEQWYDRATTRAGASPVAVEAGATATIPVVLLAAGETPDRTLTLSVAGPGSVTDGTETCTETESPCQLVYADGAAVTLGAVPDEGGELMEWSGDCSGDGACSVDMHRDRSVTATFGLLGRELQVVVPGGGAVTGTGIACPADCQETFDHGSSVDLTATPDPGWRFDGWSGACLGAGPCVVRMSQDRSVMATFSLLVAAKASQTATLTGTPKKVLKGKKGTLVATLSPCSGAARNDVVELHRGGAVVKAVAVDGSCRAVVKVKIMKRSTFTAKAVEDADSRTSASNAVTIRVRKA